MYDVVTLSRITVLIRAKRDSGHEERRGFKMLSTVSGGQAVLYAVGVALAALIVFVVQCLIIGWGVSIAVRSYRWCMRGHDRAAEIRRLSDKLS